MNNAFINVLIVDDSAVVRQALTAALTQDDSVRVIAAVADPIFAMQRMQIQWPDVIVLDVENAAHGRPHLSEKNHVRAPHASRHLLHPHCRRRPRHPADLAGGHARGRRRRRDTKPKQRRRE